MGIPAGLLITRMLWGIRLISVRFCREYPFLLRNCSTRSPFWDFGIVYSMVRFIQVLLLGVKYQM